jgi:GDP-4-dehydro-6-deoxy-D-mannose reductase
VLVTGATGFVGQYLLPELELRGCDVTCLVRDASAAIGRAKPFRGDLTVPESLRDLPREWDHVIHLAALSVPALFKSTREVLQELGMAAALLDHLQAGRVLIASSAHVYAPSLTIRYEDTSPTAPLGRYGLSKVLIESACSFYRAKLDIRVARSFNHIGAGMRPDLLIPSALSRLAELKEGEPLVMSGFDSTRDFLDVRDIVSAYLAILAADAPNACFNVSSGQGHSVHELLEILMSVIDKKRPIVFRSIQSSADDNPFLVGSSAKLRAVTGWEPRYDLPASATSLIAHR